MPNRLIFALLLAWRGWRPVASDPPPIGVRVLGLCDYTGVRSVTARREDIYFRRWDNWYVNHPTHWMRMLDALPRAQEPPAMAPLYMSEVQQNSTKR
jgi:hypothetical protein